VSRRTSCGTAGLFLIPWVLLGACRPTPPEAFPPEPVRNLLVICIDTLRADHLRSYGYPRETTPRLDALATEGAVLERTYAHSNWTIPATASLLTSLLPSEHGAGLEGEIRNLGEAVPLQLREEVRTLGQILAEASIRTGLFSGNPYLSGRFQRGFDAVDVARQDATTLTNKAVDWLREASASRFFLYMQYMDLHQPVEPPEPYFYYFKAASGGERGEKHKGWSFGRLNDGNSLDFQRFQDHKIALYDGALRYVDSEIERLLGVLEESGALADTLVVVTSDHGEEFWDHFELERDLGGDPREIWGIGHGHSMFQELLHVPLIVWGRPVASGERYDCEIGHVDVAPTLLALLGMEPLPDMRGKSLARLVVGQEGASCPDVPVVAESPAYGPDARAVIWRRRKLVERHDGVELLFDLRSNPGETHNLATAEPDTVNGLRLLLELDVRAAGERARDEQMDFDEDTIEELRALGYLN